MCFLPYWNCVLWEEESDPTRRIEARKSDMADQLRTTLGKGLSFIRTPWGTVQEALEPPSLPPAPAGRYGRERDGSGSHPAPEASGNGLTGESDQPATPPRPAPRRGERDDASEAPSTAASRASRGGKRRIHVRDLSREELIEQIKKQQDRITRLQEKYKVRTPGIAGKGVGCPRGGDTCSHVFCFRFAAGEAC